MAPPPVLQDLDQVGFADFVADGDGKIRRALLTMETDALKSSLAVRVALMYLEAEDINLEPLGGMPPQFRLGEVVFRQLRPNEAGYGGQNVDGYQILMNWRGPQAMFQTVSLTQVLAGDLPPNLIRDRIVLIGSTAASTNDFFNTPYSKKIWFSKPEPMAGVVVHANVISQLIQGARSGRSLLKPVSLLWERTWIVLWSVIGAAGTWMLHHVSTRRRQRLGGAVLGGGGGIILLGGSCYLAFLGGWVIPVIAPVVAFITSSVLTTNLYQQWKLKFANQRIQAAKNQLEITHRQLIDYSEL